MFVCVYSNFSALSSWFCHVFKYCHSRIQNCAGQNRVGPRLAVVLSKWRTRSSSVHWQRSMIVRMCSSGTRNTVLVCVMKPTWCTIYLHFIESLLHFWMFRATFHDNTDIAWVAYKAPMTPWRWQPLAETCRGKIWNTSIKSTSSLTNLLVIWQRYCKMRDPTIKIKTLKGVYSPS
jgi:hypothetical protein